MGLTDIQLRSDIKVEAIQWMGDDEIIEEHWPIAASAWKEKNG